MSTLKEVHYFTDREAAHAKLALEAKDMAAKLAHLRLAALYRERVETLTARAEDDALWQIVDSLGDR